MKDRMTLGRDADVAESAALTLADENAERRMLDALDREHVEWAKALLLVLLKFSPMPFGKISCLLLKY